MEDKKTNTEAEQKVDATDGFEGKESPEVNEATSPKDEKPKEDKKTTKKKSKEAVKIEELEAEVKKLNEAVAKDREAYLRSKADLENVRKRLEENAIQERKYASLKLVSEIVNPVDMLCKVCNMETEDEQMKNFLIGFKMIAGQLTEILQKDGLVEIEAKGKPFDPNVHQAVAKEHVDGVEPDIVLEVLQTGYKYKDRLIKPAMVKVSE